MTTIAEIRARRAAYEFGIKGVWELEDSAPADIDYLLATIDKLAEALAEAYLNDDIADRTRMGRECPEDWIEKKRASYVAQLKQEFEL